jgi:hypothetical protein
MYIYTYIYINIYVDSTVGGIELEVLNLIAKLPGVIIYRECKARLDQIKVCLFVYLFVYMYIYKSDS